VVKVIEHGADGTQNAERIKAEQGRLIEYLAILEGENFMVLVAVCLGLLLCRTVGFHLYSGGFSSAVLDVAVAE
jgi:hypothetical protein